MAGYRRRFRFRAIRSWFFKRERYVGACKCVGFSANLFRTRPVLIARDGEKYASPQLHWSGKTPAYPLISSPLRNFTHEYGLR